MIYLCILEVKRRSKVVSCMWFTVGPSDDMPRCPSLKWSFPSSKVTSALRPQGPATSRPANMNACMRLRMTGAKTSLV